MNSKISFSIPLVQRHALTTSSKTPLVKVKRVARFVFLLTGTMAALSGPPSYAQNLKPADKTKVSALKARFSKALRERANANATLQGYRVFQVVGKVQAGDNTYASLYGSAYQVSGASGAGSLSDDNFLFVKNPVDENYSGSRYLGNCTFLGVISARNTYLPVERQPNYIAAYNAVQKWKAIESSIQAEIDAVYLPYQRKAKNQAAAQAAQQTRLAQLRREKEEAQAATEAENQARVDQAREKLGQEQRALELAKQERFTKGSADAEIARLEAEAAKAKAEKARLDAEAQKQAQEEANQKAKELEETEAKNQAAIEVLKTTPSIVAGVQLGKVRLGMTEAQVLQVMGQPKVSLQLRKVDKASSNNNVRYYAHFHPRKIRRDRYFLDATKGLNISYRGSADELEYLAQERGLGNIKDGDLKENFIFDVFYLNDKVVQLESDSPQFFTADQKSIFSALREILLSDKPYDSHFILDYRGRRNGATPWGHDANLSEFGSRYIGNLEKGISVRLEAITQAAYNTDEPTTPSPFPRSRTKIVVHAPNTLPYTGDYQLGISLFNNNKQANQHDADNVEERMYDQSFNPTVAESAVSTVIEPEKENVKEKIKRGIGGILRRR